ncbi:MAG TPA: translocation/assembly module TamB domain-containing protein, partial [Paracoccaceae bacterium]|nr:translocation/assembly module TamB domain-containing protein [Paracoccaceae bacterium]
TLSELSGSFAGMHIRQEGPLSLQFGGGRVRASGIDLALPEGGRLSGDLAYAGSRVTGRVAASALDLAFLGRLAGLPVRAGRLDAEARLDAAAGSLKAAVRGFRHDQVPPETGDLAADLDAEWDGRRARLRSEISGDFGAPMRAEVTLPVRPDAPLPQLDPRGSLSGRIDWQGEIAAIWAFVPLPDHDLSGPATVALELAGTPEAPEVAGTLALSQGRYQNLAAGVILTGVTIASRLEADRRFVVELSAKDGRDGTVTGEARIAPGQGGTAIDVSVKASKAVLVRRDDLTARLDADIAVRGTPTRLAVTGTVGIDRAEVRLVNATPPAIITLPELRFRGDAEPGGESEPPGRIRLDLTVTTPGQVFVRGRGLDSEWRADLKVRGTVAQPRVTGEIEKVRGRFLLLGKSLDLEEGTIRFHGGADIDPELRVVLERTDYGITGQIAVTGTAKRPEIGLTSSPALSEDEVLPRLLFGTSKQALTPAQALQLAAGVRTLTTGAPGPLDVARETLGIDVLQVDPTEEGDAAITVGKNVAPGVFVGAKREVSGAGEGAVTIELDLFRDLKAQGALGADRSSIGLEWSRDF